MNKLLFPLAALTLGLAACSSDNIAPEGGNANAFENGGYAKIAIDLPSRSASAINRAPNDQFEDGLASEYKVNDATLLLFQGDNEAKAKFHSAYNLNVSMADDNTPQITTTTKIVRRVSNELSGGKLYAYVVLNANGLVHVEADDATATVNGESLKDKTIAALQGSKVSDVKNFTKNGFLMSNAPLANKPGDTSNPKNAEIHTLVDFSKAVYKTEAEAQANPATDVYVERAVAKVTVNSKEGTLQGSDVKVEGSTDKIAYTLEGWNLDVTNNLSYFARNVKTDWNEYTSNGFAMGVYRFVGGSPVRNGVSLYRTYWGIDPNYGGAEAVDLSQFTTLPANKTDFTQAFGVEAPQYCMENTFDVANQNQNQTTRVVLKVKIGNGDAFYTFNDDKSTLYTKDNMEKRVKAAIVKDADVISWWKTNHAGQTLNESMIVVTYGDRDAATGHKLVEKYTIAGKEFKAPEGKTLNETLGLGDITEYEGGYAYYPVRIKHFGDDLTPWSKGETDAPTAGNIYPKQSENNYLGRYGVLRNNWYNISVNSISGLGSATVPALTAEPDDELYNYVAVRINILSWAKRNQNEDL